MSKYILHPEIEQREFPNTLNKSGQESNKEHLFQRMEKGKKMMEKNQYIIHNIVDNEDNVVVETEWIGRY